jgi:hypothetical protein
MNDKARVVWFHYNKPASTKAGRNILTVHFQDVCHLVEDVVVNVPMRSVSRKTQPRCVIKGMVSPKKFLIKKKIAYIG